MTGTRLCEPRKTQYPRHFDERSASDQHFPLRSPRRGIEIAMTLPIQQPLRPNLWCCPQRLLVGGKHWVVPDGPNKCVLHFRLDASVSVLGIGSKLAKGIASSAIDSYLSIPGRAVEYRHSQTETATAAPPVTLVSAQGLGGTNRALAQAAVQIATVEDPLVAARISGDAEILQAVEAWLPPEGVKILRDSLSRFMAHLTKAEAAKSTASATALHARQALAAFGGCSCSRPPRPLRCRRACHAVEREVNSSSPKGPTSLSIMALTFTADPTNRQSRPRLQSWHIRASRHSSAAHARAARACAAQTTCRRDDSQRRASARGDRTRSSPPSGTAAGASEAERARPRSSPPSGTAAGASEAERARQK